MHLKLRRLGFVPTVRDLNLTKLRARPDDSHRIFGRTDSRSWIEARKKHAPWPVLGNVQLRRPTHPDSTHGSASTTTVSGARCTDVAADGLVLSANSPTWPLGWSVRASTTASRVCAPRPRVRRTALARLRCAAFSARTWFYLPPFARGMCLAGDGDWKCDVFAPATHTQSLRSPSLIASRSSSSLLLISIQTPSAKLKPFATVCRKDSDEIQTICVGLKQTIPAPAVVTGPISPDAPRRCIKRNLDSVRAASCISNVPPGGAGILAYT
ncbi:hypothetical protein B0H10DRAFT_2434304 [Mycena sp. CBHHK59/15]|nr:hypothetical protein B0H10DRAFT_2434304 [Mycena sp. CBHHK59/15]